VRVLTNEVMGPVSIAAGLPYNIHAFSIADLRREGVARVSLPSLTILSSIRAMTRTIQWIRDSEGFDGLSDSDILCSPDDIAYLLDS
jgi:2-methylisocitrate lyase-like PEP mutase family enzyme